MKLHCKSLLLFGIIALNILSGCVRDDSENCITGIDISFYSKISCQTDMTYIEHVDLLMVCVFDKDDVLVTYLRRSDVDLSANYTERVELESGLYSVLAWTGVDDSHFNINELQNGITKKSDILFRLKRIQDTASSINGTKVYYGQNPIVFIDAQKDESVYLNVPVNLLEITNRFTITVAGLAQRPDDIEIIIESDNGSMNIDGSIANDEVIKYESSVESEQGIMKSELTVLKLETGHANVIVIRNKVTNTELYRGSLLGTLLLKNPEVNLDCDHDFTIAFTAEDQCDCGTYVMMEIWVNNWLVHSYETEM